MNIPYKNLPPAINGVIRNAVGHAFDQLPVDVESIFPGAEDMAASLAVGEIRKLPGNFQGQLPRSLGNQLDQLIADQVAQLPFPVPVPPGLGQQVIDLVSERMRSFLQGNNGSAGSAIGSGPIPPRSEWPPGKMPIPIPGNRNRWIFVDAPVSDSAPLGRPKRRPGALPRPEGPTLGTGADGGAKVPGRPMDKTKATGKASTSKKNSGMGLIIVGGVAAAALVFASKR